MGNEKVWDSLEGCYLEVEVKEEEKKWYVFYDLEDQDYDVFDTKEEAESDVNNHGNEDKETCGIIYGVIKDLQHSISN